MSRFTDVAAEPAHSELQPLPIVDWPRLGQRAPQPISFDYGGPDAKLPAADIVVLTWTSAEWSALDHVFLNSDSTRSRWDDSWRKYWHLYSRSAPKLSDTVSTLWGYYQMVSIPTASGKAARVLLLKSESHLSHPPWIAGLESMVQCIVQDSKPAQIYSIGTAGGSTENESLGDIAITNCAHLWLKKSENTGVDYNNQTFTCDWFPSTKLLEDTQKQLFFPLSNVVTHAELEYLLYELNKQDSTSYTPSDLVNGPLSPEALHNPQPLPSQGRPLLTTDFYYIADGPEAQKYVVLEMDDAVIAHQAGKLGVKYSFVRNISDPVVAEKTAGGDEIPASVREDWSSLIYENFGLYTSHNGALTTWATIAGGSID